MALAGSLTMYYLCGARLSSAALRGHHNPALDYAARLEAQRRGCCPLVVAAPLLLLDYQYAT